MSKSYNLHLYVRTPTYITINQASRRPGLVVRKKQIYIRRPERSAQIESVT